MGDIQIAIEHVKTLASQYQAMADASKILEKYASVEQMIKEGNVALDRLAAERNLLLAEVEEAKSGLLLLRDQGEKVVREAEEHAESVNKEAVKYYERVVEEASVRSETNAKQILADAQSKADAINVKSVEANSHLDALVVSLKDKVEQLSSLDNQINTAQTKLDAISATLAGISQSVSQK